MRLDVLSIDADSRLKLLMFFAWEALFRLEYFIPRLAWHHCYELHDLLKLARQLSYLVRRLQLRHFLPQDDHSLFK